MSAYSVPLSPRRCVKCGRPATCEVFNNYNASCGYHCAGCGRRTVEEIGDKR